MKFGDIVGHKEGIAKLVSMADMKRIPHALLLHGPSGIGKMALARAFIQYINCSNPSGGDSCGQCPNCLQTAKLNNPDIHFIYPIIKRSSPSRTISSDYADEWREFISESPFMPVEGWLAKLEAGNSSPIIYKDESEEILRLSSLSSYGRGYKIFVIWQPEKMNEAAANKLLKVIEEPFGDTLFILVSNNPTELMPTIRSRLQDVAFKSLPEKDIIDFFISRGKTPEEARSLSKIAAGNINKASELVSSEGEFSRFNSDFINVMRACYARKMVDLKNYADTFAGYGREKSLRLLDYFARMTRESFISNLKCEALEAMTVDEKKFVERFGPFINAANVEEICHEINRARNDISRNANQKIVWFDLFIELTRLIRTKGGIK